MIRSTLTEQGTTPPRSTVDWLVPPALAEVAPVRTYPRAARLGAAVAAAICVTIALGGWLLAPPSGWVVGAIGCPGTTVLAWRMAPKVIAATRGGAFAMAVALAIGAILVADALVVGGILVGAAVEAVRSSSLDGAAISAVGLVGGMVGGAAMGIFLFLVGAIVVGIPVSVIVMPAALIWAAVVRHLAGRGWAR
jgi:hypothetical protein